MKLALLCRLPGQQDPGFYAGDHDPQASKNTAPNERRDLRGMYSNGVVMSNLAGNAILRR